MTIKIEYHGRKIKAIEIFLLRENKDLFDDIYITHTIDEKKDINIINVEFQRSSEGNRSVSSWDIDNKQSPNDRIYVGCSDALFHLVWFENNEVITDYHIPLHQIEFIKTDRGSLY